MILKLALFFLIATNCFASTVTTPYVYSTGDTVTNVKLNSNQNAITNVVNGGLDNTNINTTGGYRLFQTVAALPSAGSQGAVYFLTSDNSLNFDTGSVFNKSVSVSTPTNGDVVYYNSGWQKLAIGSANTLLSSNGTIPSYGFTVGTAASNVVQLTAASKLPAVDGSLLTNLTATVSSIKDYGTSGSASSAISQANLKVAYGTTTAILAGGTFAISNMSFTNSTSYSCTTGIKDTNTSNGGNVDIVPSSGSAATITNQENVTHTVMWQCIGT